MALLPKELTTETSLSKITAAVVFVFISVLAFVLGTRYQSSISEELEMVRNKQSVRMIIKKAPPAVPIPTGTTMKKSLPY